MLESNSKLISNALYSRKDLGDKVSDSVTPDSQKSTLDQAKDTATGAYDKAAGAVQPEDQKSTTQKATDTFSSGKDDAQGSGDSYLKSAQDSVSSGINSASESLGLNSKNNLSV